MQNSLFVLYCSIVLYYTTVFLRQITVICVIVIVMTAWASKQ